MAGAMVAARALRPPVLSLSHSLSGTRRGTLRAASSSPQLATQSLIRCQRDASIIQVSTPSTQSTQSTPSTPSSLSTRIAAAQSDASTLFLTVLALSLSTSALMTVGAGPAEAVETATSAAVALPSLLDPSSSAASSSPLLLSGLHALGPAATLGFIPAGPFASEFWDNVGRFVIYFFTVFTGGLYSLVRPVVDSLKKPTTAIFVVVALGGTFYVTFLTLSAMLGMEGADLPLEGFQY